VTVPTPPDSGAEGFLVQRTFRRASPEGVLSGAGCAGRVPRLVGRLDARRVLVATTRSFADCPLVDELARGLGPNWAATYTDCRQHVPSTTVARLAGLLDELDVDAVVSIGGSSVFDTVKAALWAHAGSGARSPLPQIAVPTTLSAGEFTPGAGTTDVETHTKTLVSDPALLPRFVVLDPVMTQQTPDRLWCSTGIKALDHAVEALWSGPGHPVVDVQALAAIGLLRDNLQRSRDLADLEARAACQVAAWMSIAGVSAQGLRLSHFLGHQVGAVWDIPHGITSCVLLPTVMRHLAPATGAVQVRIGRALRLPLDGLPVPEGAACAAAAVEELVRDLDLPTRLGEAGASRAGLPAAARAGYAAAQALGLVGDLPEESTASAACSRPLGDSEARLGLPPPHRAQDHVCGNSSR